MRLFFALELPAALRLAIDSWRDTQFPSVGRPVPAANLHITLAFLGELAPGRLEALLNATDEWLTRSAPPGAELHLDQTGFRPRPGLYWLAPGRWPQELDRLAAGLGGVCQQLGGRRERRRYQPHVTLFRGCQNAPPMPAQAPDFRCCYRSFTLFESRQGRRGVSYEGIAHWNLG